MTNRAISMINLVTLLTVLVSLWFVYPRRLTEGQQEAVTQYVAEECTKQGGTMAMGMTSGDKDITVVALCILNKKGTGV